MPIKRGKQIRPERPLTILIHSNAHDTGPLSHGGGGVRLSETFNLRKMNKDGSKVPFKSSIEEGTSHHFMSKQPESRSEMQF